MAQGIAIFSDVQLTSGQDLKGKVPRSKKKALCDVKNTLLRKATPAHKEPQKAESGPLKSDISCKVPVKDVVQEMPAKSLLKQDGTFTIACDDVMNGGYWDPCQNSVCRNPQDFIQIRSPTEQYREKDIQYLRRELFSMLVEQPTYQTYADEDHDINIPLMPETPLYCLSELPDELPPPSPIPLSSDEQ